MKNSAVFTSSTYSDIANSNPDQSQDPAIKKSVPRIKGFTEEPLSADEQVACNMATD